MSPRPTPALAIALTLTTLFAGQPAAAGDADLAAATKAYNLGDYATALKGLLPLARAGDADVQVLVAGIYARGLGTPADPKKAAAWYQKAADQGQPYATTMLGWFYLRGLGVPQDAVKGYRLLARAASHGQPQAARMQAAVADRALAGLDDLVAAEAKTQGIDLTAAYMRVGETFTKGYGVPRLPQVAAEAFKRAGDRGSAAGQYEYGRRLDDGDGVAQDAAAALTWFQKAADQGHADAEAMIARAYLEGRGVAKDRHMAMVHIVKARAAGSELAKQLLDDMSK